MKTDIIIPVWNQLDFTKACIENIFANTKSSYRLIIVDNASSEPIQNYLSKLAEDKKDTVTLIRNEENLGFVKATNQGIRKSSAGYVCLLNNDTRVTEGWLEELTKVAERNENVGIVNANSNTLGCKPRKNQSIEDLAKELKRNSGKYNELAWATGFCMLIKRQVIEKVGLLDEIYGMGNFEDADFSKRAQSVGYISVCAEASYVYHQERRSFIKFKRFNHDFERNRRIFHAKWGKMQRILYVVTKDDSKHLEQINQEALKLVRQGNIVWFITKALEKERFAKHSNIYVFPLSKNFFNIVSLWRVVKRKKKFDKIYIDSETYRKRLNAFKFLHKAEVIYAE